MESGVCPAFKTRKNKNMINAFEVNVLVNGNRCKQYNHNGRLYIEAKHGSEYEIEIKNNSWSRYLALTSVDGLSVLNGETAGEDDQGYILDKNSPLKIKGFRYSNNEVAAFKFTTKSNSYANATGGSTAAQNCGVIGVRLFSEDNPSRLFMNALVDTTKSSIPSWSGRMVSTDGTSYTANNATLDWMTVERERSFNPDSVVRSVQNYSNDNLTTKKLSFDMGSTWGRKVNSNVVEVEFEKGHLVYSVDIHYASRESLIEMGIPLFNQTAISFPKSFPKKFAEPPSGWRG
jgi:hypothetical protein